MMKFRPRLRLYMLLVYGAAGATILLAQFQPGPAATDPVLVAILFVVAALTRVWPVHVGPKTKVTVEETATFAAVLLLAPTLAGIVAGSSSFVGGLAARKRSIYNRVFNACAAAIATTAAAVTFRSLAPADGALFADPLAVPAAAVVNYLVRTEIADVAVGLQIGRPLFASWWPDHRRDIGQQAALFALGALAAVTSSQRPWTLLLFIGPMLLVLLSLRETTRLRAKTKAAIVQLADLIDRRDRYTYGHSMRVADLANRLARHLKLSPAQIDLVTEAARVHDIGKITTPDAVLQKPGPFAHHEREVMRRHSTDGHDLLRRIPEFWEGAHLVLSHHERVDGTGYPQRLRGDEVPLEASIIAVCDAYDAMSSDRVYRRALPWARIVEELAAGRDRQWSGEVVDGLLAMLEIERVASETTRPSSVASAAVP